MTKSQAHRVRPALRSDFDAIDQVLARAFSDDPVWTWAIAKRPIERPLGLMLGLFARVHFDDGLVSVAVDTDDTIVGVAVWVPPGHWKLPPSAYVRHLPRIVKALGVSGLRRISSMSETERRHPTDEHYYLALIGTDPSARGHGVGTMLIEPMIQRCDDEGLPAYLESSKESNLAYYRRFGFAETGTLELSGGPTLWFMRREVRD